MFRIFKKSREYPIQKDEQGKSLRKRAFELFDKQLRPAPVAKELNANFKTICRYFQDWKKLPRNYAAHYKHMHKEIKNNTEFSNKLVKSLSGFFNKSEEEIITRLQKPGGLASLLKGEWAIQIKSEIQSQQEQMLDAALSLVKLMEMWGKSPEWIKTKFDLLLDKARLLNNRPI